MEPTNKPEEKTNHPYKDSHTHEFIPNRPARFYVIIAVLIIIVLLLIIGLIPRLERWGEIQAIADNHNLYPVTLLEVHSEKKPVDLVLPGSTTALRFTPIWARVDGYLENFFVDIGDQVKEGDLLATIDTPEIDKQLLQARADVLNTIAQLEIAKISADRWSALYQRNPEAVPKQEVDERNATLHATEASLKASQANMERLEKLQAFKYITAPFSGIITQRNIDIGSLITSGSAGTNPVQLFVIDKTDIIRVFVNVPQFYYRQIYDGMTANITISEFPNREFKGYVARTAKALDPVARTLSTEVHTDNRDGTLKVGLFTNVTFSFIPEQAFFIVPTNSVIITDNGPTIAVVDDKNVVKKVPVTLGRDYGKTMEITTGLKENDRIVVNPDEKIHDGLHVSIRKIIKSIY